MSNMTKQKLFTPILLAFAFLVSSTALFAKEKGKEKSAYEKLLGENTETHRSPFLTLHQKEEKLYFELERETLSGDFLAAGAVSSVSAPQVGLTGFKISGPLHMRFAMKDSVVVLSLVNTEFVYDKSKSHLAESSRLNYGDVTIERFNVVAFSPDSASVVIDVTDFLTKDNRYFDFKPRAAVGTPVSAEPRPNLDRITEIKAFKDNATVKVSRTYSISTNGSDGRKLLDKYPVTYEAVLSFFKLPEDQMTPRLSDARIGVFQNSKMLVDPETGLIKEKTFVNRWDVTPSDVEAYKRGEAVSPRKPIVFYVDTVIPRDWIPAIKKGILRWNAAFEKIGFKDVVRVKDFPTPEEDPEFDPDNLKYSCIRFIPVEIQNAMGPSWTDPRTGEIINAGVFVYGNVLELVDNWRFVQTSQVDERARTGRMPDEIRFSTLEYVIAHEIGHCLGFMHNMAASSAFPTDSLRSIPFTQKYGTTPSIMDYARFNYIAQPGDEGVALEPPYLGVYDYFLVDWTYRYFPDLNGDFIKEDRELRKMVDSHEGDPRFRYVMQQLEQRVDASAVEEDLGDDPVKSAEYGLKNLRYIIPHLSEWVKDDETSQRKQSLYLGIMEQAYLYLNRVAMNISGIRLNQSSEKSGIPRYFVIPKEEQRRSLMWLLEQGLTIGSMSDPVLESKLYGAGGKPFDTLEKLTRKLAVSQVNKVYISHHLDPESYSPEEYSEDVYNFVFHKTLCGDESLTTAERNFQREYVKSFANILKSSKAPSMPFALSNGETNAKRFCTHSGCHPDAGTALGFGTGYGESEHLWTNTIVGGEKFFVYFGQKAIDLLSDALKVTADAELREHYAYLLRELKRAAKTK